MKKNILALMVMISPVYTNATVLPEDFTKTLVCPKQIECSKDKSVSSCKTIGDDIEYWGNITSNGAVKKGTYFLTSAYANYQSPSSYQYIGCSYTNFKDDGTTLEVLISFNGLSSWEATTNDSSRWGMYGYQANCNGEYHSPLAPESCPFKKIPAVRINSRGYASGRDNGANVDSLSAYANNTLLLHYPYMYGQPDEIINIYKAWDACSDTGLCTINLIADIPRRVGNPNDRITTDIGSIVVDMDDEMKIIQVKSNPTVSVKISKKEGSNTIEMKPQLT